MPRKETEKLQFVVTKKKIPLDKVDKEFWKAKTKKGIRKKFTLPELKEHCIAYFKWNQENPLVTFETVKYQGESKLTEVPKMRAMTMKALCIYLGISGGAWANYKKDPKFTEFCDYVTNVIFTQKFQGACADLFNANIIARELGLKDHNEHTGKDGEKLFGDLSDKELKKRIASLTNKDAK